MSEQSGGTVDLSTEQFVNEVIVAYEAMRAKARQAGKRGATERDAWAATATKALMAHRYGQAWTVESFEGGDFEWYWENLPPSRRLPTGEVVLDAADEPPQSGRTEPAHEDAGNGWCTCGRRAATCWK